MIQLKLTNAGLSAFTNTTNYKLTLTHFVFGSSYDEDEQAIQDESPVQFNIDFQETYIKGQTYQRNGSDVVEEYNHIKIIGYFSADNVSTFDENGEYLVKEIALMGSTTENANICLAYGYDVEGVKLIENTNTIYTVKLDLIFENAPNISVNNSVGTVTYRDFLDHVDKTLSSSTPVHGLQLINNRLYINGQPLTIDVEGVSNAKMDNIVGIDEEVEVLPATTNYSVGDVVAIKDTGAMYKNTEVLNNNTLENQWIATGSINSQLGILNSYGSMIPLRTNNTAYVVGDPVKTQLCKPFQYLECIASGTSGNGSVFSGVNTIGDNEVGTTYVDGTCIWMVCDMRDGTQVGEIIVRPFSIEPSINPYRGFFRLDNINQETFLGFSKTTPINGNANNFKYLRLVRLLRYIILSYTHSTLFMISVTAGTGTYYTNSYLLWLSAMIILMQWTITPLVNELEISDEAVDMVDISSYNTAFNISYTKAQYKSTAQTFLNDILKNTGAIVCNFNSVEDHYLKMQASPSWINVIEDEGLPNITGFFGSSFNGTAWLPVNEDGGAFYSSQNVNNIIKPTNFNIGTGNHRFEFNASRSNSIFGNNSHVVPRSLHVCPYIKL